MTESFPAPDPAAAFPAPGAPSPGDPAGTEVSVPDAPPTSDPVAAEVPAFEVQVRATASATAPHPPGRVGGIDMVRAIALIGVVVMNYHGYLNSETAMDARIFAGRLFNPWIGVLSTRFAATFVMVAGVGVTLLTRRSVASGGVAAIRADRWRLRRRGLLLLAGGYVLNWIWSGTILPFYGMYFVLASFLFTWRARLLVALATAAALVSAGLHAWTTHRTLHGGTDVWIYTKTSYYASTPGDLRSPRNLVAELVVNGTHPLVPWLAFLIVGMLLGRTVGRFRALRLRLIGVGLALLTGGYGLSTLGRQALKHSSSRSADDMRHLLLTDPFSRGLLYTVTAIGSSLVAIMVISAIGERWPNAAPVRLLAHAGQMTLTLYVLHAVVFNEIVTQRHLVRSTGLDTALVLSGAFWIVGIGAAAAWHRWLGMGPLERLYRSFGG